MRPDGDLTEVLQRWRRGDDRALEALLVAVHREARRALAGQLRRRSASGTLQPAELAQAIVQRLVGSDGADWRDRTHLLAICARVLRRVLVAHARCRSALRRRPTAGPPLELDSGVVRPAGGLPLDVIRLDAALSGLAALDARQARVVEMRYFGGLLIDEAADVLQIPAAIVRRDWDSARLWLYAQLRGAASPSEAGARSCDTP